jgi:hypothetical protein
MNKLRSLRLHIEEDESALGARLSGLTALTSDPAIKGLSDKSKESLTKLRQAMFDAMEAGIECQKQLASERLVILYPTVGRLLGCLLSIY